jgi:hypothetical protein
MFTFGPVSRLILCPQLKLGQRTGFPQAPQKTNRHFVPNVLLPVNPFSLTFRANNAYM